MTTLELIEKKISLLQSAKEHFVENSFTEEELRCMFRSLYHFKDNLYRARNDCDVYFLKEGDTYRLIRELDGYSTISYSHDQAYRCLLLGIDNQEKIGVSAIFQEDKKCIPIYDIAFKKVIDAEPWFISVQDDKGKTYSTLITESGDIYRIKVAGKYIDGFSYKKY